MLEQAVTIHNNNTNINLIYSRFNPFVISPVHVSRSRFIMTSNYSLYAIPAFWVLSLFPHGYAVSASNITRCSLKLTHL